MSEYEEGSSTGPRRSARTMAKAPTKTPHAVDSPSSKRKAREHETPADALQYLLTDPKSKLTKIDISDIINYNNFLDLSEASQQRLCALLPSTAFETYIPSICASHPERLAQPGSEPDAMDVDRTPATLDPAVFTSPFFLSAAHTWQDHLFSSWLGKKASDDLAQFTQGAQDGTLHADWKDEAWERDHMHVSTDARPDSDGFMIMKQPAALDLTALAKRGLLQKGDVVAYRRSFPQLNAVVEKDLLVENIHPISLCPSFLLSPGTGRALPPPLLIYSADSPYELDDKLLSIAYIADPTALERGVLDVDGRVSVSDKFAQDEAECPDPYTLTGAPSARLKNDVAVRAWKAFTVWRWRDEVRERVELQVGQERGARERVATLFYLRGVA
ncbi:Asx homology domain-containing protein [Daedaleopsis nitida]|nr:Asx homology domain-containing protein [Daedaleopsis nitida]